jgi:tetratricopeptide (TPR) repeat protein
MAASFAVMQKRTRDIHKSILLAAIFAGPGALLPVDAQIDNMRAVREFSRLDERFDYWGRCSSKRYDLEHRLSYCKSILADGRHRAVEVLTEIGNAYFEAGKYPEAIASYENALAHEDAMYVNKLDEYRTAASARLEEALVLSGQFDAAIEHVNARLKDSPDDIQLYNQRCRLRAIAGKELDSALADCNEALKRQPDNPDTLDSRGLVNFKLGNLVGARADYDAALHKSEDMASSRYMRGIIELRNGDTSAGNDDIDTAKQRDPVIAALYAHYGVEP